MGKSFVWRSWGQGGLQRWVEDPARRVGHAGRSIKWYVADTWAERHGELGAKLFIDGQVALSKFGFKTAETAVAWADRQKAPSSCEHDWWPGVGVTGVVAVFRVCKLCRRQDRRHRTFAGMSRWKLALPSAQNKELPR